MVESQLLGRKEVDRKLGGEPNGQGTGREGANKGNTRGKGDKNWGKQGAQEWEKGNERAHLGKGEGRGLITQAEGEGEGQGKVALY